MIAFTMRDACHFREWEHMQENQKIRKTEKPTNLMITEKHLVSDCGSVIVVGAVDVSGVLLLAWRLLRVGLPINLARLVIVPLKMNLDCGPLRLDQFRKQRGSLIRYRSSG